ncbi:hypothetical protein CWC46_07925 [Prodigiosinella confusarubida]|uniref:Uncharacterized protein n=1 Tax=Serratia sp. (strain ATCC 39006) TaxID=104623 RepID=A0A2I5T5B8_SERS3|nr:hypothetical protein [Serratia sp. ATCC 39006]AUG99756.1 hypothetical protein CWC46_07925 [Serratia sp. ATCC 39006]AUH04075.1 hypothetical protein Ser39006_007930 [Serratia sp. ATCC 39006]
MAKFIATAFLSFSVLFSTIALADPYVDKTGVLMNKQQLNQWRSPESAAPYFALNGRLFYMTIDDFASIIDNTYAQCDDLDAYTNRKGVTKACKDHVFSGIKEIIALSKDKTVSDQAWKIGTRYAWDSHNPVPGMNVWDFNGWAAGIRVAKSKGY